MSFINMFQGGTKSNRNYFEIFKSSLQILILEGVGQIFCSDHILVKATSTADDAKINAEEEKFKVICFLMRSGIV